MEYLEGISLKAYAKEKGGKVEKDELLEIMRPVLESLIEVHKSGIIHRDISPDNIMICKDKQVKLIDFGAARETSPQGEKTLSVMLKKGYSPEEQYRTHGEQGTWTDVYALSATIYTMLTGVKPDEPLDRMENETLQPLSKMGVELTRRQEDVIMKGLAIKASDRVQTIEELYRGLYRDGKDNEFAMRKKRKWKLGAMIATLLVVGCASACVLAYRMIPVKPAAVICYEAQVNQDVQAGDLQEYLPEGAQEIRFSMGDVLSNHLMINNMPESGDAYELEVQYEQGGRQFIQQLEVSVKAPLVSALVPKVTCEAGQKIADYTPYFQVQNGEHLNLTITDNTNSETAGVQEVTATLQSGEYAFATASLQVDYYDMQLEKEKLLTLLQEYKQGTLKEDKDMKNCAEKFMEQAVSMEFGAQWSTVLQTCSDAVIGAYPKVSYTEAMAVPVYGRADQINYSAEAFYQELIQNENFTTLLASTEKIGIAAQTVYGEKQMAVYWCIYCK